MRKGYRIANTVAFVVMIIVNYLTNLIPLNGITTGEVSASVPTLFTPAAYVFSIWGLIYLLLLFFVIYQFTAGKNDFLIEKISPYFIISCVLNSVWIILWHYQQFFWTVIVIIALLISLILIYVTIQDSKRNKETLDPYAVFSIYLAWLCVATIANISVFLSSINWDGFGLGDVFWTVTVIIIGMIIALYMTRRYKDIIFSLVFMWAYIGISVKLYNQNQGVAIVAIIATIVLLLNIFSVIKEMLYNR